LTLSGQAIDLSKLLYSRRCSLVCCRRSEYTPVSPPPRIHNRTLSDLEASGLTFTKAELTAINGEPTPATMTLLQLEHQTEVVVSLAISH